MNTQNQPPTPRTDAEEIHASEISAGTRGYYVPADFARRLEHENAELWKTIDGLHNDFVAALSAIAKAKGGQP